MATVSWIDRSIDPSSEFELTAGHSNVVVVTMPLVTHEDGDLFALGDDRRVWDPGIHQSVSRNTTMLDPIATMITLVNLLALTNASTSATTRAPRAWDPGIDGVMFQTPTRLFPLSRHRHSAACNDWPSVLSHFILAFSSLAWSRRHPTTMTFHPLQFDMPIPFIHFRFPAQETTMVCQFPAQLVSVSTHAFVAPTVDRSNPHNSADKCRGALIQSLFHYSHPVLSRPTVPNINT